MKHPFKEGVTLSAALDKSNNTEMSYTSINNVYPSAGLVNGQYGWLTYFIYAETPMVFDVAAIKYIYGANNNYKTGDDTYTFDWDSSKRSGNDVFYGGLGDDVFMIDSASDSAMEYANEGKDTIWVSNSYSIAGQANIENLYLFGSNNATLTGNSADNYFMGSSGNDTIDGGSGIDYIKILDDNFADCTITTQGFTYTIKTKTVDTDTFRNIE